MVRPGLFKANMEAHTRPAKKDSSPFRVSNGFHVLLQFVGTSGLAELAVLGIKLVDGLYTSSWMNRGDGP